MKKAENRSYAALKLLAGERQASRGHWLFEKPGMEFAKAMALVY